MQTQPGSWQGVSFMGKRRGERPLYRRRASRRGGRSGARGLDPVTRRHIERAVASAVTEGGRRQPRQAMGPVRATQAFRFRKQTQPLWWAALTATGLVCWKFSAVPAAAVTALAVAAATVALTRSRPAGVRAYHQSMAAWCGLWMTALAATGAGWWMAFWLAGWAAPSAVWVHRHRWRPQPAPRTVEVADTSHADTFRELAEAKHWSAWLENPRQVPSGIQYTIHCRGTRTHIDTILSEQSALAAAFESSVDQVYAEADPSGAKHLGVLTLLRTRTLAEARPWDVRRNRIGSDGLAVVGRFPDGRPLRERVYVPGIGGGVRHTIIAGADGTGKTGLLNLLLAIAAATGWIAPIILDPQEGQALPAWQDRVPYACGLDACLVYLRGLREAMYERSRTLAQMSWTDPKTGRKRKGMGFYSYELCGLPLIMIVIDESPILLADEEARRIVLEIGKLGRKVGFRLVLAAQVPSIAELGQQELRSMLVGGNVFCFRTGDKVSGSMVNLKADPWELPKYWADGSPTVGLGYSDGPDARPAATMRTDWLDDGDAYDVAESLDIRGPDDAVAGQIASAIMAAEASAGQLNALALAKSSAQIAVLRQLAGGRAMHRGLLVQSVMRTDGLSLSEVTGAIESLTGEGRITETARGFAEVQA